jgi:hypothetical protein
MVLIVDACASVAIRPDNPVLLGYLAVLGAALAGYAGLAPWAIAATAIALAALSRSQHFELYRRGQDLGLTRAINVTGLRSFLNSVVAAGLAYGTGWALRVI